ncbi:hypothetical protein V8C86DRAFT_3137585 [Haematococcus lacustris]
MLPLLLLPCTPAEETVDAERSASWGLVAGVGSACLLGLLLMLSLTFSMQSLDSIMDPNAAAGGQAIAQASAVAWDVFKARYGQGRAGLAVLYIPAVGLFMCGANALTSSSRAVYVFSRDGAMLGSAWWHRLSEGTQQPWSCIWLMACLALLAALPAIFNPQFATALSATSVVALSLSYLVPIALALWRGDAFLRGAFSLGSWSRPLARLSCAWISLMSVVFCLPMHYPITLLNANWTPLLLALLLAFAAILWWAPHVGGCHWFIGPLPNITSSVAEVDTAVESRAAAAVAAAAEAEAAAAAAVTAGLKDLSSRSRRTSMHQQRPLLSSSQSEVAQGQDAPRAARSPPPRELGSTKLVAGELVRRAASHVAPRSRLAIERRASQVVPGFGDRGGRAHQAQGPGRLRRDVDTHLAPPTSPQPGPGASFTACGRRGNEEQCPTTTVLAGTANALYTAARIRSSTCRSGSGGLQAEPSSGPRQDKPGSPTLGIGARRQSVRWDLQPRDLQPARAPGLGLPLRPSLLGPLRPQIGGEPSPGPTSSRPAVRAPSTASSGGSSLIGADSCKNSIKDSGLGSRIEAMLENDWSERGSWLIMGPKSCPRWSLCFDDPAQEENRAAGHARHAELGEAAVEEEHEEGEEEHEGPARKASGSDLLDLVNASRAAASAPSHPPSGCQPRLPTVGPRAPGSNSVGSSSELAGGAGTGPGSSRGAEGLRSGARLAGWGDAPVEGGDREGHEEPAFSSDGDGSVGGGGEEEEEGEAERVTWHVNVLSGMEAMWARVRGQPGSAAAHPTSRAAPAPGPAHPDPHIFYPHPAAPWPQPLDSPPPSSTLLHRPSATLSHQFVHPSKSTIRGSVDLGSRTLRIGLERPAPSFLTLSSSTSPMLLELIEQGFVDPAAIACCSPRAAAGHTGYQPTYPTNPPSAQPRAAGQQPGTHATALLTKASGASSSSSSLRRLVTGRSLTRVGSGGSLASRLSTAMAQGPQAEAQQGGGLGVQLSQRLASSLSQGWGSRRGQGSKAGEEQG